MGIIRIHRDSRTTVSGASDEVLERLRKASTVRNPMYDAVLRFSPSGGRFTKVPSHFRLYDDSGGDLEVPRGLNVEKFLGKEIRYSHDFAGEPAKFPKPLIKPHDLQEDFLESLDKKSYRDQSGTYLFVSPAGSGKSFSALLAARKFGLKTLILVDRILLIDSWLREIEKTFGIPKKEVGIIRQARFSVGDVFTIATTQTLRKRTDDWEKLWEKIGCLIVDECDLVPSSIFFDVVANCPSRYLLGITATERRKDGLHKVMYLSFGKPVHRVREHVADTMVPISKVVEIQTTYVQPKTAQELLDGIPDDPVRTLSGLTHDTLRNQSIVKKAVECFHKGRTTLISVVRREHADVLSDLLHKELGSLASAACPLVMLGGEDNDDAAKAVLQGKCKIVIATAQLIKRGVNLPMLDCLIVAGPMASRTNINQLVGRIRRAHLGKSDAWVFDLVDSRCPMLRRAFYRERVPVYRELGVQKYQSLFYT